MLFAKATKRFYRDPWLKAADLLGVSADQAKRLTQSRREFAELVRQRFNLTLMTSFVFWRNNTVLYCTVLYCTQVRRNLGLECTWKPAGMNTNIFPESFFIFGSITMIWYKIRFSLLIPQKSENFDILSRFNLHMRNINLLVTIR